MSGALKSVQSEISNRKVRQYTCTCRIHIYLVWYITFYKSVVYSFLGRSEVRKNKQ